MRLEHILGMPLVAQCLYCGMAWEITTERQLEKVTIMHEPVCRHDLDMESPFPDGVGAS